MNEVTTKRELTWSLDTLAPYGLPCMHKSYGIKSKDISSMLSVLKVKRDPVHNRCCPSEILEFACLSGLCNCRDDRYTLSFSTSRCQSQRVEDCL